MGNSLNPWDNIVVSGLKCRPQRQTTSDEGSPTKDPSAVGLVDR